MEKLKKNRADLLVREGGTSALALSLTAMAMLLSMVVLVPEPSLGSEPERRRPDPEVIVERFGANLDLSEEQREAVNPVIAEAVVKRRELFDRYRAEERELRQRLRSELAAIDQHTADELAPLLHADQLMEFGRLLERHRLRQADAGRDDGNGRRHRPGFRRVDSVDKSLVN